MGKFSDPNYKLLKDYFDILVAERTGTDKSYLIGPNKTVVADGGLYTILYEDHPTRGYVGHRFIIDAITGNRFEMTYAGLESNFQIDTLETSTTSAELSAFGIGNDFYFRKDSFFHFWLARPTQDDAYHDYCNQEKTFLFFGKIWPDGENKYSIEFEGLKDFTLKGLPEHNQTVRMTEWLKVYWDQIHHQMYSMTKHFWSMFDAREIDLRWLGYIANIYGIEISEQILNELSLREWVENLPYFLKRIGTYNALYIIWKVFMQNTQNKLNVYERWGEWCTQTLDELFGDIKDAFEDHHYLEFYGIQPSGGAGDWYYSQYDPAEYPTHTLTAPVSCGTFSWRLGTSENFLSSVYANLNCSIGLITGETIEVTGYDPQRLTTSVMYLSGGNYSGNFTHSIGIEMDVSTSAASNLVFWAMSNEVAQISDHVSDYVCLSYETSGGGNRYFKLTENEGGVSTSVKTTESFLANKPYYIIITRTDTTLSATIFDRERKWAYDLVESISLTKADIDTYSNLYVLNAKRIPTHGRWYGTVYALYTQGINYTRTVGASGNPVITPHYKVQIDLSTEPLGDVFDDATIISENVITELYKNFEYVRPVNKYAHYEELIAPLAQIDRVGDSIPLYSRQSNGFFNTFFTGSQFLSAGGGTGAGGVNTSSHFQQFASKTWTITHELGTENVLVQPWVFTGINADNAQMIIPDTIQVIDDSTIQVTFNESYRGVISVAGETSNSGITYTLTSTSAAPSAIWGIDHNLDTLTPPGSGYSSPPGPVSMYWDNNGYRIFPEEQYMANDDRLEVTWDSDTGDGSDYSQSGTGLIRRSDYYHIQSDPSSIWNIPHNLNSFVIAQFYRTDPSPANNKEFFPRIVKSVDENNLQAQWDFACRGFAHIVQVPRERVVYSPYTCDEFGVGICADVLGYWKVGTGEDTLWNPFVENDLESPVASGTFYKIEDDLNTIFIDFIVPENAPPVNIKEVGLFNYLDDLILYSRSSGLYKPDNVQTYFHYRVTKLNSSSSSSVSSSSTSSSSESSSSLSSSSSESSSSSSLSSSSSSSLSSSSLSSSSSSSTSGIPIPAGIGLINDSLPLTNSLNPTAGSLIDSDRYTSEFDNWNREDSFGLVYSSKPTIIDGYDIWCYHASPSTILNKLDTTTQVLTLYHSTNNSTWVEHRKFHSPVGFSWGANSFAFRVMDDIPSGAKYIKFRNSTIADLPFSVSAGIADLKIAEIEPRIEITPTVGWSATEQHPDFDGAMDNPVVAVKKLNTGSQNHIIATHGKSSGKWYFEVETDGTYLSTVNTTVGIRRTQAESGQNYTGIVGDDPGKGIGYLAQGRFVMNGSNRPNDITGYLNYQSVSIRTIGVYVDMDNLNMWFTLDGGLPFNYIDFSSVGYDGDPENNLNPSNYTPLPSGTYYPAVHQIGVESDGVWTRHRLNAMASNIKFLPSGSIFSPWDSTV